MGPFPFRFHLIAKWICLPAVNVAISPLFFELRASLVLTMRGTIKEVTFCAILIFIAGVFVEIVVLAVIFLRSAPFFVGLLSMASTKVSLLSIIVICLRLSCLLSIRVVAEVLMCGSTRALIWRVLLRVAGAIVLLFDELIREDVICSSYLLKAFFILLRTLFALNCIGVVLLGNLVELFLDLLLGGIAL